MTVQELAKLTGKDKNKVNPWINQFSRTKTAYEKKNPGLTVIRVGKRGEYEYYIQQEGQAEYFLQEDINDKAVATEAISFINMDFAVLLALLSKPDQIWNNSYKMFLKYMGMEETNDNVEELKEALVRLDTAGFIHYYDDDSTPIGSFMAGIISKQRDEVGINNDMVTACFAIAARAKRDWRDIMKVWLGVKVLSEYQPYTQKELSVLTGIKEDKLRRICKVLEKEEVFVTDKCYVSYENNVIRCLGKNVNLNALESGNR